MDATNLHQVFAVELYVSEAETIRKCVEECVCGFSIKAQLFSFEEVVLKSKLCREFGVRGVCECCSTCGDKKDKEESICSLDLEIDMIKKKMAEKRTAEEAMVAWGSEAMESGYSGEGDLSEEATDKTLSASDKNDKSSPAADKDDKTSSAGETQNDGGRLEDSTSDYTSPTASALTPIGEPLSEANMPSRKVFETGETWMFPMQPLQLISMLQRQPLVLTLVSPQGRLAYGCMDLYKLVECILRAKRDLPYPISTVHRLCICCCGDFNVLVKGTIRLTAYGRNFVSQMRSTEGGNPNATVCDHDPQGRRESVVVSRMYFDVVSCSRAIITGPENTPAGPVKPKRTLCVMPCTLPKEKPKPKRFKMEDIAFCPEHRVIMPAASPSYGSWRWKLDQLLGLSRTEVIVRSKAKRDTEGDAQGNDIKKKCKDWKETEEAKEAAAKALKKEVEKAPAEEVTAEEADITYDSDTTEGTEPILEKLTHNENKDSKFVSLNVGQRPKSADKKRPKSADKKRPKSATKKRSKSAGKKKRSKSAGKKKRSKSAGKKSKKHGKKVDKKKSKSSLKKAKSELNKVTLIEEPKEQEEGVTLISSLTGEPGEEEVNALINEKRNDLMTKKMKRICRTVLKDLEPQGDNRLASLSGMLSRLEGFPVREVEDAYLSIFRPGVRPCIGPTLTSVGPEDRVSDWARDVPSIETRFSSRGTAIHEELSRDTDTD